MTIQFPIMSLDYFQPSPARQFVNLTKNPRTSGGHIGTLFQQLKSIQVDDLIGEWDGYIVPTGHPFEDELEDLNWFGNTFDATDDVAPLTVARNGQRVCYEDWGRASVSSLLFPSTWSGLKGTPLRSDLVIFYVVYGVPMWCAMQGWFGDS
jgi:hypothetical protein